MRYLFITLLVFITASSNAQIDLQTGSAQYSIPIFSYADPKSGLSHDIAVTYNSGQGIKVNQLSSNIGLGWSLMAGGQIIRISRGSAPDDQYNPDAALNNLASSKAELLIYKSEDPSLFDAYYPNGFFFKKYDINYLPKQMAFQPRFGDDDESHYKSAPMAGEDTEQDEFMININGIVKIFKIAKIGGVYTAKYEDNTLWKTDISVEDVSDRTFYNQSIITKIKSFTITDETGLKYTFDKIDLDEMQQAVIDSAGILTTSHMIEEGAAKYIVNKWVLSTITNPITNSSISFNYTQEDDQYFTDLFEQTTTDADNSSTPPNGTITIGNSHTKVNILQQIVFPNGITANFTMGTTERLDVNGGFPLSKIEIIQGTKTLKTAFFNTAYFNGENVVPGSGSALPRNSHGFLGILAGSTNRLALNSINIIGMAPANYAFKYYVGTIDGSIYSVPSRMSKWRDLSGLQNSASHVIGNENTSDNGTTELTGLLKDIQTTTNNKISYSYRLARFTHTLRGVLVNKITYSDLTTNTTYTKAYAYCNAQSSNLLCDGSIGNIDQVYPAFYDNGSNGQVGATNSQYNHIQYNPSDKKKFGDYVFFSSSTQSTGFAVKMIGQIAAAVVSDAIIEAARKAAMEAGEAINPYIYIIAEIAGEVCKAAINSFAEWLTQLLNGNSDQDLHYYITYDHLREQANPLPLTVASTREYDMINNTFILKKTCWRS